MKMKPLFICPAIASLFLVSCLKKIEDGKNALVEQTPEPPGIHCATGGVKIISGIDENRNHGLDSAEIQQTEYVCNGNYDKETIIYFSFEVGHTTTAEQVSIRSSMDFDITNYLADSASFNANLLTQDANVKAFVELYDLTNNTVLKNSVLSSNSTTYEMKTTTENFIKEFPKGPIKLAFRIRAEKPGTVISVQKPMLRLYKKI